MQVIGGIQVFKDGIIIDTNAELDLRKGKVIIKDGIVPLDDDYTVKVKESGAVFTMGTDAKSITLPTAEVGLKYKFINIGADGNNTVTLSPQSGDGINGTIANAAADSVASGGDGKDLVNTKSTANKGDYVEITCFVANDWVITGGVGIFASEA